MRKLKKAQVLLVATSATISLGLIVWAFVAPAIRDHRAAQLAAEGEQLLSPPLDSLVHLEDADCARAAKVLQEAAALDPHSSASSLLPLAQGCASFQAGDLVLARSELEEAQKMRPQDPRSLRWLGAVASAQSVPAEALEHHHRALKIDPTYIPSQVGLADAFSELGMAERALSTLAGIEGGPYPWLETRRGIILEELGRVEHARQAYTRAAELAPSMAEPLNNLAALERSEGHLDRAWELQGQALSAAPEDPLVVLNAGLLAIALGYDDRAHELLARAAELDDENPDPLRALADHKLLQGDVAGALELLIEVAGRFPTEAALLNSLGNAYAAAGRADRAQEAYRAAVLHDDSLSHPHNGLAALYLNQGSLDDARRELEAALRLDPHNTEARKNLAVVHARQHNL